MFTTMLIVIGAVLLIVLGLATIALGYDSLFKGDILGWFLFGHGLVEAGEALIKFAIELIAASLKD